MRLSSQRRAVERLMVDECVVSEPAAGEPTVDRVTGTATRGASVEIYRGRCQVSSRQSSRSDGGDQVDELALAIPFGSTDDLAVGQRVVLSCTDQPGFEWSDGEWEIVRLPVSSLALSQTAVLRRRSALAGLGGGR